MINTVSGNEGVPWWTYYAIAKIDTISSNYHPSAKTRSKHMDLVFKNKDAVQMLIHTADAACRFKVTDVTAGGVSLQLLVCADGEEIMYGKPMRVYVGDTIELPGVKVEVHVA